MSLRSLACALLLLFATVSFTSAQTWIPLTNQPNPNLALSNPLLLTDGTVLLHEYCAAAWYKLIPDASGSYLNGTIKRIASLPAGYGPLYFGSAVLPDGRVMIAGGEYNGTSPINCQGAEINLAAIYDPKANKWTSVAPPAGWQTIGDAQGIVLPDGTYMQANCCTKQAALLNAQTLTWTPTGHGKFDFNNEEGWNLLPDGTVLTVDTYIPRNVTTGLNYEIYHPKSGDWKRGAPTGTIVQLWDVGSREIGPAVLRPDGTLFYTGANGAGPAHTAIYDTNSQTWTAGPDFPDGLDVADGPATLLPDGNVLVMTSPGVFNLGAVFFEWDGSSLTNVTHGMTDAPTISSFYGNMLILPTGEILFTDFANLWIYRSKGQPNPAWAPQITSVPSTVHRGGSYTISGFNFNGFSQGAAYGDDTQAATNYPLVRLTNRVTLNVYYARTHDHSTMAIAYSGQASTTFDVSAATETGLADLQVIANGIASPPVTVNVQ